MNDFITQRIDMTALSGDVRTDLLAAFGPQGDQFRMNLPEGHVARLWDFGIYCFFTENGRYGINLAKAPVPRDGVVAYTSDVEVLEFGGMLTAQYQRNELSASGQAIAQYPHTEHLWDLDYRLVSNPRVTGFSQTSQVMGFRLRYRIQRASIQEIASILMWQNQGVKVA